MKNFFKALLIVAAVATGFGVFSLGPLAAVGTTIAAGGVAGAFAIVGAIGTITAGVGAITGNQKLIKIGGIAAMIGGIGAFAANSGWLGASNVQATSATALPSAAPATEFAAPLAEPATGLIGSAPVDAAGAAATAPVVQPINTSLTSGVDGVVTSPGAEVVASGTVTPPPMAAEVAGAPVTDVATSSAAMGGNNLSAYVAPSANPSIFNTLGGYANSFGTFAKENPLATAMMMSTVSGAFDTSKEGQNELAKAQAEQLKQQQANVNAVPDMTGFQYRPPPLQPLGIQPLIAGRPPIGLIGARG